MWVEQQMGMDPLKWGGHYRWGRAFARCRDAYQGMKRETGNGKRRDKEGPAGCTGGYHLRAGVPALPEKMQTRCGSATKKVCGPTRKGQLQTSPPL